MTPAEIQAVKDCAGLAADGALKANMNERLFVERLAGRVARGHSAVAADLPPDERNYLRKICGKIGVRFEEIPEERSGTAREAPSTRWERGSAEPAVGAAGRDVGAQPAAHTPEAAALEPTSSGPGGGASPRQAQLVRYDAARRALSEAVAIDEVKDIRDRAIAIKAYAEQADDNDLISNAFVLQARAERRLGELIGEAKAAGQLSKGGQPHHKKSTGSKSEPVENRIVLSDLGVSKKLSSGAQKVAAIPADRFEASVEATRKDYASGKRRPTNDVLKALSQSGEFAGARATMAARREAIGSLDYSPTPPWATRALFEIVLPHAGVETDSLKRRTAYDPACGEGHMTGVFQEYFREAWGSDVFDYGQDERWAPGWRTMFDYLDRKAKAPGDGADWIVTNPPFMEKALGFALRAIDEANEGAAIFAQLRWLEGQTRYEQLFYPRPPTIVAIFIDRVECHMGQWDPEGKTATAYMWLVWRRGSSPMAPFWIPPGSKRALTKADDAKRFTAHPVLGLGAAPAPAQEAAE